MKAITQLRLGESSNPCVETTPSLQGHTQTEAYGCIGMVSLVGRGPGVGGQSGFQQEAGGVLREFQILLAQIKRIPERPVYRGVGGCGGTIRVGQNPELVEGDLWLQPA